MRIFILLCLAVIFQLVSAMPVCADGSVDGSFTVDDTPLPDIIPPAEVDNLVVASIYPYSIKLKWTAPGDDYNVGTAAYYDIRFSMSPITNEVEWANSIPMYSVPKPQASGSNETITVNGLLPLTTYYFALKTADEVFNWSGLSNYAVAQTTVYLEWEEEEDYEEEEVDEDDEEEDELPQDEVTPVPLVDYPPVHFDIKGCKGVIYLNLQDDGSLTQTWIITLNNGLLEIILEKGTILSDSAGRPVSVIVIKCVEPFGEVPEGFGFSAVYDFQTACNINPAATMKMRYLDEELDGSIDEEDIYIAYYNQDQGIWEPLAGAGDVENNVVTTSLDHFSSFCLVIPKSAAGILPPEDEISPYLDIQDLTLSSKVVEQGESLSVNVSIVNQGDIAGDFLLQLIYDKAIIDSRMVTLTPKQEKIETFSMVLDDEGTHTISVGSKSALVTVNAPGTSAAFDFSTLRIPLLSIAIAGLVVTLILVIRNRRNKDSTYSHRI